MVDGECERDDVSKIELQDIEMRIEFRTHCPKCGMVWVIGGLLNIPEPHAFKLLTEDMIHSLNKQPKTCCDKKLPEIGKEWSIIWPV